MIKHVGVRPVGDITLTSGGSCDIKKAKIYIETLPEGGKRRWTSKALKSGCKSEFAYPLKEMVREGTTLLYCPHCNEWFNEKQFKEI